MEKIKAVASAPTRIDLAGGTLDIAPVANILQDKMGFWKSSVKTVNAAINLKATAAVEIELCGNTPSTSSEGEMFVSCREMVSGSALQKTNLNLLRAEDLSVFTLHLGVTKALYSILKQKKVFSVHLETNAMAPRGSGLGGSSSVVVCLLQAFNHALQLHWSLEQVCEIAKNIEAGILGSLAGNQDHMAAAHGGVLCVEHSVWGSRVCKLPTNGQTLLEKCVLAYSNQQHFSAFNNWCVLEKFLTSNLETYEKFKQIALIAERIIEPLKDNNFIEVGRLMSEEWKIRRTLAEGITTPKLNEMYEAAMNAGAVGGKVCGAGGGGVLIAMCNDVYTKNKVQEEVQKVGGTILDAGFSAQGVIVG
jgi:D-glycero-alpha-D-manno-heptose-7-phosphate kinase